MSGLKDMEEMLESICDIELKDFMKEAYLSYMAGAYKSSIIVSAIAVYEDLRKKTSILTQVNTDARYITIEVDKRLENNEVFESFLVDQLTSKKILNANDKRNLELLRVRRNLAAHPTGYVATAEEARFIYSLTIKEFLSKPLLYANEKVHFLLKRLNNKNFFPSNDISDICFIVNDTIIKLHESVLPFLVVEILKEHNKNPSNQNPINFLFGLVSISNEKNYIEDILLKKYIETEADKIDAKDHIIKSIALNSNLYIKSDNITKGRIKKILNQYLTQQDVLFNINEHPTSFFNSVFKNKSIDYIISEFKDEFDLLINKDIYNKNIIDIAFNDASLKTEIIAKLITNAGSTTFSKANEFASRIKALDKYIANNISPNDCLKIINALLISADWGAREVIILKNNMFNAIPKIKQVVITLINSNYNEAIILLNPSYQEETGDKFITKYLN